jgi:L-glyceraldehyde 3-phosphate reductase
MTSPHSAAPDRYDSMPYRRVGSSGLLLPAISLGLWQNFGDDRALATQRAIVRRAFDRGVTHFDFGNNYGPPNGSAERNFGQILRSDRRPAPSTAGRPPCRSGPAPVDPTG